MAFLTVIQGGRAEQNSSPMQQRTQAQLENYVRELLLNLYCPEIGVTVCDALAVIRDCCVKKSSLVSSPWIRFSSALNDIGIFVEIASPDEELDEPLYLFVLDTPKLLAAHPELTRFKAILESELEFG